MSKVEEIRQKYSKISQSTFKKFDNADVTVTKKYLLYMCIIWDKKLSGGLSITPKKLIDTVILFDKHIPYIKTNTDIYAAEYRNFFFLEEVVETAIQYKLDKEFDKEKHIEILIENDEYLLLIPKTFEGSLKYGANTKWCTASKSNSSTFTHYNKQYHLIYLVNKSLTIDKKLSKIAFLLDKSDYPLTTAITTYNQLDTRISDSAIAESGWGYQRLTNIIFEIRTSAIQKNIIKQAKQEVDTIINIMSAIDMAEFQRNLNILNNIDDTLLVTTKEVIETFNKKMEEFLK